MAEQVSSTPLREVFLDKVVAFEKAYPDEGEKLGGELLSWGSFVGGEEGTLWDLIESQIRYRAGIYQVEGHETNPEDFIDYLFAPNPKGEITADIIMGRLQVG
ncbi:hypothetical protein A2630_02515 [Candidatus Woesebacteria bacterium RIFCSPHIGHO2_01_FULL_44_10]|uniref:Uncharacterized protein n=1 Tax=Candidatus Woesebacteria bacterium RIFCSPLOWO2_01_FULL_44_14 TaxID=1802525 RepID=A0A1F8C448_9BACT|nr:MAG: hypothetical protein A2630_02515 [Candidatus Woesebacteria bacterium RIFCSPHIGHO2_01_FULL_44_10]OGM55647.1 MAG: hypothetical protein A3F62_02440 [Candidatus Woesebacteria bacterium RIFCSPHIGHO2_12_FULL_44_11]OGM70920.1 MAG: hypothetical protein A2975_01430 [Candidatus Woesebacteria bacterium RIFCSPLOWO2_01_FULL_44_14]